MARTPPPDWFTTLIADHVTRLYALNLESYPAGELLEATTLGWIESLWHRLQHADLKPDVDQPRIEEAFARLAVSVRRWPAPAMFFDHLPERPKPKRPLALPAAQDPDAIARRVLDNAARREELLGRPFPPAVPGQVP